MQPITRLRDSFFGKKLPKSSTGAKNSGTRLSVEPLEERAVPSSTPDVSLTSRGASGTINGAIFSQTDIQPTGTGYIDSFLRVLAKGNGTTEQGYNTDARPVQYNELTTGNFTRSIRLSDVPEVTINGYKYRAFLLDVNQNGKSPNLSLDQLRIYLGNSGSLTGYDPKALKLAGLTAIYDMDWFADHWVKLDCRLSTGSGSGDMYLYVPSCLFGNPANNPYVYLYSKFGENTATNGGFEEWAVARTATSTLGGGGGSTANTASLSGYVYADDDWSGLRNGTEAGIGGIVVVLTGTDGNGNAINMTTTTGADGSYSFTGLSGGTYSLTHLSVANLMDGPASAGTVNGVTDGTVNGAVIAGISLKDGEAGVEYDFAEHWVS
jgi:hypothetical protein